MDLRLMAVIMAFAIIMDVVGRMARKRAAGEQPQESPEQPPEGWNIMQALADADELPDKLLRDALPPARTRSEAGRERDPEEVAVPRGESPASRMDAVSGRVRLAHEPALPKPIASERVVREPVPIEPVTIVPTGTPATARVDPGSWDLPMRDRSARPIEVRPRDPRAFDRDARTPGREPEERRTPHPPDVDYAPVPRRSRSTDLGERLGLTDARALRRVVVAREVLGPPLALRDDDVGSGGHRS